MRRRTVHLVAVRFGLGIGPGMNNLLRRGVPASDEFKMQDTHRIVAMPNHEMLASSEGLGWRNVYAVVQREAAFDSYLDAVNDHLFIFHLKGSVGIRWSVSGHQLDGRVTPGHFDFFPGREGVGVQLSGPVETMHLYLRRSIVDAVVEDMFGDPTALKLNPIFNRNDPFLEQIAMSMRTSIADDGVASRIYVEQLSWALAAHLVRSSVPHVPHAIDGGGLSKQQLRRVIEFIDANLGRRLELDDLAAASCLSAVYFGRQFKRTTDMSPHQFVIQRRVERAKRLLTSTTQSIVEIAAACGFCHQEYLTRVFRMKCGTTPFAYRKAASC